MWTTQRWAQKFLNNFIHLLCQALHFLWPLQYFPVPWGLLFWSFSWELGFPLPHLSIYFLWLCPCLGSSWGKTEKKSRRGLPVLLGTIASVIVEENFLPQSFSFLPAPAATAVTARRPFLCLQSGLEGSIWALSVCTWYPLLGFRTRWVQAREGQRENGQLITSSAEFPILVFFPHLPANIYFFKSSSS